MKRKFIGFIMMVSTLMLTSACNSPNTNPIPIPENKDYDFSGDKVLVVMDQNVGGINKVHEKSFFGEIADQIVEIRDLSFIIDIETAKVNLEMFHQILSLTLNRDDKENVLRVVDYLMTIEGIKSAEPDYHYPLTGSKK